MLPEHDVYITDWHNARDAPLVGRPLRLRRLCRAPDQVSRSHRPGRAHRRGVPALRRGAGRRRRDGADTAIAAQPRSMTLMAGPIDCRVNPDQGERACDLEADRVVRAEPDRDRAAALSGRVPPRLSGLRAARRLHEHEHRPPREGAQASSTTIWSRASSPRRRRPRRSTTNISRCSISPPSSISRPCASCSRSMRSPPGTLTFRGEPVEPRAIQRTALFTVEGEKDDICAVGQTLAAQELCSQHPALPQAPPHAARRRPLRRVLRQEVGSADLSAAEERDFVERLSARLTPPSRPPP